MQQTQSSLFKRIGAVMRAHYHEIACEPLPERWADLIKYLNDKERSALPAPPPPPRARGVTSSRNSSS
jgi:hypothetical protein